MTTLEKGKSVISMKITQVFEGKVKVKVRKTGKTYYHSKRYAKRIITGSVRGPKTTTYFLREGNKWKEVNEGQFMIATCKEAVVEIQDKLSKELRQRVEAEIEETK